MPSCFYCRRMASDVAVELQVLHDVVIRNTVFEGHSVDKCMSEDSSRAFALSTKLEVKKVLEDRVAPTSVNAEAWARECSTFQSSEVLGRTGNESIRLKTARQ